MPYYRTTLSDDEKKMVSPARGQPAREPPVSEPPAQEPPVSEPPASEQPASESPARELTARELTAPLMVSRMITYGEEVNSVYDVAINVNTTGCEHCMELVPEM